MHIHLYSQDQALIAGITSLLGESDEFQFQTSWSTTFDGPPDTGQAGGSDAIFLDEHMAWESSLQKIAEHSNQPEEIPIILLTDKLDDLSVRRALQAGVDCLLPRRGSTTTGLIAGIKFAIAKNRHDQSEVERIERLSKEKEQRYRLISEMISDYAYSFHVEPNGTFISEWTSDNLARMTSLSNPEDLDIFGGLLSMIVTEDLEQVTHMRDAVLTGKPIRSEFRITAPDQTVHWIRNYVQPVWDAEQQRVVHVYGAAQDITLQIQTEEALQANNEKLITWISELERRNREANLLNEMGDLLLSCLREDDAFAVVGQFASEIFPDQPGALYILSPSQNTLEAVTTWNAGKTSNEQADVLGKLVFDPDDCWAMRRGLPHLAAPPRERIHCHHIPGRADNGAQPVSICIPLSAQGETIGLYHLQLSAEHDLASFEQLALTLAERITLALTNLKLRNTLHQQSIRDPLTGLFNRRYMEETFDRELRRAARHARPVGVIMVDIDHFKSFNDTYGHEAGDLILHELGHLLQNGIRHEDVACRYGGEEFILILPESPLASTVTRAESILAKIRELSITYQDKQIGNISASLGVASFPEHGDQHLEVLRAADRALYRAKNLGRGRVERA